MSFIVMELFSCSGGMAVGLREAGLDVTMAFDRDPDACASYEANIGQRPVQMDVRDLLRMARAGWRPAGEIDLITADPPCAPWSRAGKKMGLDDDRDMLLATVELVALLRPKAYLIGNIPGLQDATSWPTVQKYIGGLVKHGYCAADYTQIDAADFGVPQRRLRPFWYGHRAGPCIVWPARTHAGPRELRQGVSFGVERLLPWVTCKQALSVLPAEEIGRLVRVKEPQKKLLREKRTAKGMRSSKRVPQSAQLGDPDAPATAITTRVARAGSGDSVVLSLHSKHPISSPDAPSRAIGASDGAGAKGGKVLGLFSEEDAGTEGKLLRDQELRGMRVGDAEAPAATIVGHASRVGAGPGHVFSWPWDRPSTTVCAGTPKIAAPGEHMGHTGPNAIVLSEKAAAILQGFPPSWVFSGATKGTRWSQLGQAVPPIVAAAIGRAVLRQLEAMAELQAGRIA